MIKTMRLFHIAALLSCLMITSPVSASFLDGWWGRCVRLLSPRFRQQRRTAVRENLWSHYFANAEPHSGNFRLEHNLRTLMVYSPVFVSSNFTERLLTNAQTSLAELYHLPLFPDGVNEQNSPTWLNRLTQRTVEVVLDANLPYWRTDDDWFFETDKAISLYSLTSRSPIEFERGVFILMNGNFAIGKIRLGSPAEVELFDP